MDYYDCYVLLSITFRENARIGQYHYMKTPLDQKSSVNDIRARFDEDVERFSNIEAMIWDRYGAYLESVGGKDYRAQVFDYIDREDSPRSVTYQIDLLRRAGFTDVDLLHKNSCFAAFGAVKAQTFSR